MTRPLMRPLFAAPVQSVLERLYAETILHDPPLRRAAIAQGLAHDGQQGFYEAMSEAMMPVTPEFGAMLYILARSMGARGIVEFGASFGVSTICLAAALRDNGGGRIITTELVPAKARCAEANLRDAGLIDLVDIRVGDARTTLARHVDIAVDLIVLDAAKGLYLEVMRLLAPKLRRGGLVVSDRADLHGDDGGRAAAYLAYISDRENGYAMATIATQALGTSFSHDIAVRL